MQLIKKYLMNQNSCAILLVVECCLLFDYFPTNRQVFLAMPMNFHLVNAPTVIYHFHL